MCAADLELAINGIRKMKWDIHPIVGMSYLSIEESEMQKRNLSILRAHSALSESEYDLTKFLIDMGIRNRTEMLEILRNQPRRDAQAFIAKKNVRSWVFKRDRHRCLCCGNTSSLSVDHIISVNKGGLNRLGNLQTLCSSCNSRKSDTYADFR